MIIDPVNSKNVASVKDSNGKEIERIYDKYGNLVFKNWNTLEGPFPIGCFTSSDRLRNYRIYGNTIQDGTPTPENPVDVQGCGKQLVMTLFDKYTAIVYPAKIIGDNCWVYSSDSACVRIPVKPSTQYIISVDNIYPTFNLGQSYSDNIPTEQNQTIQSEEFDTILWQNENSSRRKFTFITNSNAKYVVFQGPKSDVNNWLNELTLNEAAYYDSGIYLDEPLRGIGDYADYVDFQRGVVVRRIKTLVLTGEENVIERQAVRTGNIVMRFDLPGYLRESGNIPLCSHYQGLAPIDNINVFTINNTIAFIVSSTGSNYMYIYNSAYTSSSDFKSYLAAQYAAGTPVTIWYVLAEPEEETISVPPGLTGTIEGHLIQDGTPTPENPIYPEENGTLQSNGKYTILNGYTIPLKQNQISAVFDEPLYAVGDYCDTLDLSTGIITKRIKKIVLTGDETFSLAATNIARLEIPKINYLRESSVITIACTHFKSVINHDSALSSSTDTIHALTDSSINNYIYMNTSKASSLANFKLFVRQQANNGTPITIWIVLATPTTYQLSDPSLNGLKGVIKGKLVQTQPEKIPTPDEPVSFIEYGKREKNLFDISMTTGFTTNLSKDWAQTIETGYDQNTGSYYGRIIVDTRTISGTARGILLHIGIFPAGTYTFHIVWDTKPITLNIQDKARNVITDITSSDTTFTLNEDTEILLYGIFGKIVYTLEDIMITEGSVSPSEYTRTQYRFPIAKPITNLAPAYSDFVAGYIDSNGNINDQNDETLELLSEPIPVSPNKKYGFSFDNDCFPADNNNHCWNSVAMYDANDNFIICYSGEKNYTTRYFTTTSDTTYIRLSYRSFGSTENPILFEEDPEQRLIYIGSEPLHKIGDYADYVDLKRGVVVRRIKKIIIRDDGVSAFIKSTYNTPDIVRTDINIRKYGYATFWPAYQINNSIPRKCSHFMSGEYGSKNSEVLGSYSNYLLVPTLFLSTVDAAGETDTSTIIKKIIEWFEEQYSAGTPVTAYYALAKPEEEILPFSQEIPMNNAFSCTISPAPSKVIIQYKKK